MLIAVLVYKHGYFFIGTKIPFSEWPARVDRYLEDLGLSYQSFLYHLEDLDFSDLNQKILNGESCLNCQKLQACDLCKKDAQKALQRQTACHRALADCPALGPIIRRSEKGFTHCILTNVSSPDREAHDLLMPLMSKIYRRYGFSETFLCYQGIDFFSRSCPTSIDASKQKLNGVKGSCILLERCSVFPQWNCITLILDVTDGDSILDATPYLDAMAALFPGVRHEEAIEVSFTQLEQTKLDDIHKSAEPIAAAASDFFATRLKAQTKQICGGAVSLAPALKSLSRQYSYRYIRSQHRLYFLEKQTDNGHYITLEFDTGRMGNETNVLVSLEGAGFTQRVAAISYLPDGQKDAVSHLQKLFAVLHEAEGGILAELDRLYPPSPAWYAAER